MAYVASLHTAVSKPIGLTNSSTDARSRYYDSSLFKYRDYISTSEVLAYLATPANRVGGFSIFINTGGTLVNGVITGGTRAEWWFKDGTDDSNLVIKQTIGVTSFNTRTGSITLTNSDITTALGYVPLSSISGITAGGDLSGTFPNPVVSQLNGQVPSYYLDYNNFINTPTIYTFSGTGSQYTKGNGAYGTFPTSVSFFTNDSGYLTTITSSNITTALGYTPVDLATKNQNNGFAGLDSSGLLPLSLFPSNLLGSVKFKGTYDGTTITSSDPSLNGQPLPTSTDSIAGYYFISTANYTIGSTNYSIGDWIISNGTSGGWNIVKSSNAISSVFGRTGVVVANSSDYSSYYPSLTGSYTNPSWITSLPFSKLTSLPTTLLGHGITNGVDVTSSQSIAGVKNFTDQVRITSLYLNDTSTGVEEAEIYAISGGVAILPFNSNYQPIVLKNSFLTSNRIFEFPDTNGTVAVMGANNSGSFTLSGTVYTTGGVQSTGSVLISDDPSGQFFKVIQSGNTKVQINPAGLYINSYTSARNTISFDHNNSGASPYGFIGSSNGITGSGLSNDLQFFTSGTTPISLSTNSTTRLFVDGSSGKVTISNDFQVSGNTRLADTVTGNISILTGDSFYNGGEYFFLNKAGTSYIQLTTRDTLSTEALVSFDNVRNINTVGSVKANSFSIYKSSDPTKFVQLSLASGASAVYSQTYQANSGVIALLADVNGLSTVYQPLEDQRVSTTNSVQFSQLTLNGPLIIKDSIGTTQWSLVLGGSNELNFINSSGATVVSIDQSGNLTATSTLDS